MCAIIERMENVEIDRKQMSAKTKWTKTAEPKPHSTEYSMGLRGRWEGSNGWTIEKQHSRGRRQRHPFERIDRDQRASTSFRLIDPSGRQRSDTCSTLADAKRAVEFRIEADARWARQ